MSQIYFVEQFSTECRKSALRECIGFALLRSVIGQENSRHHSELNQSDAKLKPIVSWSLAFSRASGRLHVLTSSSHWFPVTFSFVLITLVLVLRHSIEKGSNVTQLKCDVSTEFDRFFLMRHRAKLIFNLSLMVNSNVAFYICLIMKINWKQSRY